MNRHVLIAFMLIWVLLPCGIPTLAEGDSPVCVECGMHVDQDSKFSAWATNTAGRRLSFCDVGDMLRHVSERKKDIRSISVKDFSTGMLIDGSKAFYVKSREIKTPMSWGIAAFRTEEDARAFGAPAAFDQAFGLLK